MIKTGYHEPHAVPSFHDGWLKSILVEEHTATLGLVRSCGAAFELRLEEVKALHAEDFRQGNIISSVDVISGKQPDCYGLDAYLERLFPSPHQDATQPYHERYKKFLTEILQQVTKGDATMIVIQASYGCDLVAICRGIRLTHLGDSTPSTIP